MSEAKNRLLVSGSEAEAASDPRSVFVVHGRDENLRKSMFDFLRAVGLKPIEWTDAVRATGSGAPFIGEVLDTAMHGAQAIVVLMSPDDEARLRECYLKQSDLDHERKLTPQSRPNVLFEAGMAFGRFPERILLVEVGELRPFSDVAGRNVIRMSNSSVSRQELANRLKTAGCEVDTSGTDWHTTGDFSVAVASSEHSGTGDRMQIPEQNTAQVQLLVSMLYNGSKCWHVTQHPRGEFVVVGDRMFVDSNDLELAIDYVVAVNDLEVYGDISYTVVGSVGIEYALTSTGIQKASQARSLFDKKLLDSFPESDVLTINPAGGNFV